MLNKLKIKNLNFKRKNQKNLEHNYMKQDMEIDYKIFNNNLINIIEE